MNLRATAVLTLPLMALVAAACDASESSNSGQGGATSAQGGSPGQGGASAGGVANGSGGGTNASGGGPTMKPPSSYTFNTPGAKFPFPQGKASGFCRLPAYNTDAVATAYQNWKSKFVLGGRVVRPENDNDTVSEGIAYGMLIGVYMNDRVMFDQLWSYAKAHFDDKGLMNWRIDKNGSTVGAGSASDSDLDMAWALAMASSQWGGTYAAEVTTLLNNIWTHEVEMGSHVLKPGDNFGGSSQTNPSYFAQSYYRAFKKFGSQNWQAVYDKSYEILAASTGSHGLVPNWVNASGAGVGSPAGDANGPHFGYDAARTPFRIALDYCESGEPRAKAYLDKITAFFGNIVTTSVVEIKDGYTTSGANPPGVLGDYSATMVFYGPATVAAMTSGPEKVVSIGYTVLAYNTSSGASNPQVFNYFAGSWGTLSMLALSGNFWDMTR